MNFLKLAMITVLFIANLVGVRFLLGGIVGFKTSLFSILLFSAALITYSLLGKIQIP